MRDPADVARLAGPIQAQEPRAAKLAFRARARGLTAADVDRARTEERSLLRAWAMRRTAHLIPSDDAGWLLPLFADATLRWSRKRLADLGLDGNGQDRALAVMRRAIDRDGPLTRAELTERLEAAGLEIDDRIKVHLWFLATLGGDLCLGPDREGSTCLVRTADWLGEVERRPREVSLAELARRFIGAYGPASDRDLARWSGLPLRDARAGIAAIAGDLVEVKAGRETLLRAKRGPRPPSAPVVRLLGAFDNYNLGYSDREFAVDDEHVRQIAPGGGIIRPTITVDGRFVGTWRSRRSGGRLTVTPEPFGKLEDEWVTAIEAEVSEIGEFEGVAAELA